MCLEMLSVELVWRGSPNDVSTYIRSVGTIISISTHVQYNSDFIFSTVSIRCLVDNSLGTPLNGGLSPFFELATPHLCH